MKNYQKTKIKINQYLHFWELPTKCMFWLDNEFWNKIYLYKDHNYKSWREFSNQLNIPCGTLSNYLSQKNKTKNAQFIPFQVLCDLCNLVDIPIEKAEKHIPLSKYGMNGKPINLNFPIDLLTKEWAGLVGALLSEGSISKEYDIQFWNKDKEIISKFIELTEKIISKATYSAPYRNAYYCSLPRIVAQILITKLDFHTGDKVTSDPGIPKLYLNLDLSSKKNKDIVANLVSWLFTGDGWISLFKDHLRKTHRHMGIGFSINSKNEVPALLNDTRNLIIKFGIHPQRIHFSHKTEYIKNGKKQITKSWKFFIHGKENFVLFKKYINFQDTRRKNILQKSIESFVKPNLRKGEAIIKTVNSVIASYPCTKHDVVKDTGLQMKRIEILLKESRDKGFIRLIGGGEKDGQYGRKPYIYKYTKKGMEFVKSKR